jgi:hypothetical protein
MRDVCNRFLNAAQIPEVAEVEQVQALMALRETLRVNLLALAGAYRLVEARDLANRIDFAASRGCIAARRARSGILSRDGVGPAESAPLASKRSRCSHAASSQGRACQP